MFDIEIPIPKFMSELKSFPTWILDGFAITLWIAFFIVLFTPGFKSIRIESLSNVSIRFLFLISAILFTIFAVLIHMEVAKTRRVLRFIPITQQGSFWAISKQTDNSFTSQISTTIQASNNSDYPLQIIKVRLIKPKNVEFILPPDHSLPSDGSPYYSSEHPVPPQGTVPVDIFLITRGKLAAQGQPIRITIGITDQHGEEYKIKNIIIKFKSADNSEKAIPAS